MRDLAPFEFDRILPLIRGPGEAGHMAFVHAVLEESMPGFVLADGADAPRAAFVGNLSGFWFALGEPSPEFAAAALPELVARCPEETETALWAPNREWERVLGLHLVRKRWRSEFHFRPETARPVGPLPAGLELVPIDERVAGLFGQGLDPWVIGVWGGAAAFAARSFGYGILRGGKLVSFCAACAIQARGARETEIEIGTDPREREAGLAAIAGQAFIDECGRRHLLPAWSCASDNIPSARLASRLGFEFARHVAGFQLHPGMNDSGRLWL